MRNPWGSTEFTGAWSDTSSLWTAAYKAQVPNHKFNSGDGAFFMTLADFQKIYRYFTITYYHDDWNYSFYAQDGQKGTKY